MDREKIIKALETCSDVFYGAKGACSYCGYSQRDRCFGELVYDSIAMLKEQPEIIRCKDCFHADDFDCHAPLPTGYLCQKGHGSHMGDWFCADGERR